MQIDFFSQNVGRLQTKWNRAYEGLRVYSVRQKMASMMSIAQLGNIRDPVEFNRKKDVIDNFLDKIINQRRNQNVERTNNRRTKQTA